MPAMSDRREPRGTVGGKGWRVAERRSSLIFFFFLQSYCTRNLRTRAAKPRAARNEGVIITSWLAIALDEIRTRRILREKEDCKQSTASEAYLQAPPPFPPLQTTAGLASLADIFPIPVFCLFPHCGAWSRGLSARLLLEAEGENWRFFPGRVKVFCKWHNPNPLLFSQTFPNPVPCFKFFTEISLQMVSARCFAFTEVDSTYRVKYGMDWSGKTGTELIKQGFMIKYERRFSKVS